MSNWHDFIANDYWLPINLTSVQWIIRFRDNAGVLSQAATEVKNSFYELKDALKFIWSAVPEEATDNAVKTSASDCRYVCQSMLNILEHIM